MKTELDNTAVFPKVFHKETVSMTNTLKMAEYFGKQHKNLLRIIKELNCSNEFGGLNFEPSYYLNEQNKKQPMYLMTQDGFMLLSWRSM